VFLKWESPCLPQSHSYLAVKTLGWTSFSHWIRKFGVLFSRNKLDKWLFPYWNHVVGFIVYYYFKGMRHSESSEHQTAKAKHKPVSWHFPIRVKLLAKLNLSFKRWVMVCGHSVVSNFGSTHRSPNNFALIITSGINGIYLHCLR